MLAVCGQAGDLPPIVAFDFHAVGWKPFDHPDDMPPVPGMPNERYTDAGDVEAFYIHAYDSETGEEHWFWVRSYLAQRDWDNWLDLIVLTMEMHGMSMA